MTDARRRLKRIVKLWVLRIARTVGLFHLSRWVTRNSFIIIGWHGVSIRDEHQRFPEYFLQPETLKQRLEYLDAYFSIVPLEEALRQQAEGCIKPHQVVLTFDDGMLNLRKSALPELRRAKAPATVYLVSDTLRRETSITLDLLVREAFLTTERVELGGETIPGLRIERWRSVEERLTAARQCHAHMSEMTSYEERWDYAKPLIEKLGIRCAEVEKSGLWSYLNTADLREMMPLGVDFQLHSHLHQIVGEMGDRLGDDTRTCRETIEHETRREARDYCYPSGCWGRWCWPHLTEAGVRSAVTCKLGPNFRDTPALALRRYIDTNTNTPIEFEALTSNFLWFVHLLFHPSRWRVPSEAPSEDTAPL